MFTNYTASAAAQHQHTLRSEADQARLVQAARVTNHTALQPVARRRVRPAFSMLRRFRTA
jgi:hypothetical protein